MQQKHIQLKMGGSMASYVERYVITKNRALVCHEIISLAVLENRSLTLLGNGDSDVRRDLTVSMRMEFLNQH